LAAGHAARVALEVRPEQQIPRGLKSARNDNKNAQLGTNEIVS